MSLSVVAGERGDFRLYRGAEQVGWAKASVVAFLGFDNADEARHAAAAAYDALRAWFARQRRTGAVPAEPGPGHRPRRSPTAPMSMEDSIMARSITSTYRSPGARFSASARPIPRDLTVGYALAVERHSGAPAEPARLTRITIVALSLLVAASIVTGGPQSVAVPLAIVLLTWLGVNAALALVAWRAR